MVLRSSFFFFQFLCAIVYFVQWTIPSVSAQFVLSNGVLVPASKTDTPLSTVVPISTALPPTNTVPVSSVPSQPITPPTIVNTPVVIPPTIVPTIAPPLASTITTVTNVPVPTNPCNSGVCNVASRGTCISMENTGICSAFAGMYLPTKLNAYFSSRFPNRNSNVIPNIQNGTMFNELFASQPYSFMSIYVDEFGVNEHGCSTPNQRWYLTWFCIDILQFYINANDPCSANLRPTVCSSTLNSRADSIEADLSNRQTCLIPNDSKAKGQQYVNYLRNYPLASTDSSASNCISGDFNEDGPNSYRKCGWYSERTACLNKDACPSLERSLAAKCPAILSQKPAMETSESTVDTTPASLVVTICVVALGVVCLLLGLRSLQTLRKNANANSKPSEDVENSRPGPITSISSISDGSRQTSVASYINDSGNVVSIIDNRNSDASLYMSTDMQQPSRASLQSAHRVSVPRPLSFSPPVQPAHIYAGAQVSPSTPPPNKTLPSLPARTISTRKVLSPTLPKATSPTSPKVTSPSLSVTPKNISPTAPVAPEFGVLPSKAQPTRRPPNSRANLQPVLSPIPDTPSSATS